MRNADGTWKRITEDQLCSVTKILIKMAPRYRDLGFLCGLSKYDIEAIQQDCHMLGQSCQTCLILMLNALAHKGVTYKIVLESLDHMDAASSRLALSRYVEDGARPNAPCIRKTNTPAHPDLMALKLTLHLYRSRWFPVGFVMGLSIDHLMLISNQLCSMRMDTVLSDVDQVGIVQRAHGAMGLLGLNTPDWMAPKP